MNDMRRSELSRKVCGWMVRDGFAAVDGTSLPWGLTLLYYHGV